MGDLTKNLSRHEFACKCECGFDTVDYELVNVLQSLRDDLGASVGINSGCRCEKHNKAIGGGLNSQHLYGRAADIVINGVSPDEVQKYFLKKYQSKYGIGRYDTFTHIDTRGGKGRWDLRVKT